MNKSKPNIVQVDITCSNGKTYTHDLNGEYDESYIDLEIIPLGDMVLGSVRVAEVLVDRDGSTTTTESFYSQPMSMTTYYETRQGTLTEATEWKK